MTKKQYPDSFLRAPSLSALPLSGGEPRQGFSLVEMLIYFSLLALVSTGIFTAYTYFIRSSIEARSLAELSFEAKTSVNDLTLLASKADRIKLVAENDRQCAILTYYRDYRQTGAYFPAANRLEATGYYGVPRDGSRSFAFWLRQDDATNTSYILNQGRDINARRFNVITLAGSGVVGVTIRNQTIKGRTGVADGRWHHVAVVFDRDISPNLTTESVAIYIDGIREPVTASSTNTIRVNTLATLSMRIGGHTNRYAFTGYLSSLKVWGRALRPNEITTELLSPVAVNREDLHLEATFNNNRNDTSDNGYILSGFVPRYASFSKEVRSKASLNFRPAPEPEELHQLWIRNYIDTTLNETMDICTEPDEANQWRLENTHLWQASADRFFTLESGVLSVNANIARKVGDTVLSDQTRTRILAGSSGDRQELCRIAPAISGFNTGDLAPAQAVVRVDDTFFEQDVDELTFFDADLSGPFTETINGETKTYYTHKNIRAEGVVIWDDITAEYEPSNGIMRICTSITNNCGNSVSVRRSPDKWEQVFRELTYRAKRDTYMTQKSFFFSMGDALPCHINNYIACRSIGDNDFDDDPNTCFHWFRFYNFSKMGNSYNCRGVNGFASANYNQCRADWEDSRRDAHWQGRSLFGLRGYLGTITTSAEQLCVGQRLTGAKGWLGASDRDCERNYLRPGQSGYCGNPAVNRSYSGAPYGRYNSRNGINEGRWYWVTGPEGQWSQEEPGYRDHNDAQGWGLYMGRDNGTGFDVFDPPDIGNNVIEPSFTNWAENEPNNWRISSRNNFPHEDYLHTWPSGLWNDYTSYYGVEGYLGEYGGMAGDPDRILTQRTLIDTFAFLKNCR